MDIAVIPANLASMLQPLDFLGNKPFRDIIKRLYADWMDEGDRLLTRQE